MMRHKWIERKRCLENPPLEFLHFQQVAPESFITEARNQKKYATVSYCSTACKLVKVKHAGFLAARVLKDRLV